MSRIDLGTRHLDRPCVVRDHQFQIQAVGCGITGVLQRREIRGRDHAALVRMMLLRGGRAHTPQRQPAPHHLDLGCLPAADGHGLSGDLWVGV